MDPHAQSEADRYPDWRTLVSGPDYVKVYEASLRLYKMHHRLHQPQGRSPRNKETTTVNLSRGAGKGGARPHRHGSIRGSCGQGEGAIQVDEVPP